MTGGTKGGALDRRRLREMFAPQARYASSNVMPLDGAIRAHVKPGIPRQVFASLLYRF